MARVIRRVCLSPSSARTEAARRALDVDEEASSLRAAWAGFHVSGSVDKASSSRMLTARARLSLWEDVAADWSAKMARARRDVKVRCPRSGGPIRRHIETGLGLGERR